MNIHNTHTHVFEENLKKTIVNYLFCCENENTETYMKNKREKLKHS